MLAGPLRLGIDASVYKEHVGLVVDAVRQPSPSHLDWMLDLAETLAGNGVPGEAGRLARVDVINATAAAFASLPAARVGSARADLLRSLCNEIGLADPLFGSQTPDAGDAESDDETILFRHLLDDRRLGVYSLDDGTPARVRSAVARLAPGCRVETNADTTCTAALRSMAKGCDLLVVATRKAGHAATGCIDAHGGRGKVIYPSGRGSSSILAALRDEATRIA